MGSDPDGSFISLLLSTDPTAAAVKSAVFLVMLLIIIILSLFCGSVVTASQTEVRRLSDHGSKKAGKALFLLGGEVTGCKGKPCLQFHQLLHGFLFVHLIHANRV